MPRSTRIIVRICIVLAVIAGLGLGAHFLVRAIIAMHS
jgi:hypothetical protein